MTSTASVFAFLLWRTIAGATRRRLARLREPRYLAGGLVGGLYIYFWFVGPLLHGGLQLGGPGHAFHLPEATTLVLVLAAAALALNMSLFWLFHSGTPTLHVSEAEVQFLAPAPLPRRALLHFSLIRTELALLFTAFVVALVLGRLFVPHFWQAVVAAFLVFSTLQLHAVGQTFWKAHASEASPATRHIMHATTLAAALLGLSVLAWLVAIVRAAVAILLVRPGEAPVADFADFSLRAQALRGLHPWTVGFVPQVLLAPFRAVLAPALAADSLAFAKALPAALAILAAHYVWVVRANVRYEEAALEGARRAAARLERRSSGRLHGLPSEARRVNVPFPLPSEGSPEVGVLWKNLISRGRVRLSRAAALWVGSLLFGLAASTVSAVAYPGAVPVLLIIGIASAGPALGVALALPMSYRNDFREDLEKAALLRTWPLSPVRLAAAELAAPLVISVGAAWALLSCGVVGIAGGRLALVWRGAPWAEANAGPVPTSWIAPALIALAILLPALAAAVLVIQNAAVLTFPAWFPPGGQRPGFEATGTRLISFAATLLLLTFALTPAALVTSFVAWLTWRFLGPWSLLPASALGSLPVWLAVAAGLAWLGRLFARFDVSTESWS